LEGLTLTEGLILAEADGLTEGDLEGETLVEGLTLTLGLTDGLGEGETDGLALGDTDLICTPDIASRVIIVSNRLITSSCQDMKKVYYNPNDVCNTIAQFYSISPSKHRDYPCV
jgi:hypothetical protein